MTGLVVGIIVVCVVVVVGAVGIGGYFIWRRLQQPNSSVTSTSDNKKKKKKNNEVRCIYSKAHEPMVELSIGQVRTFAVFDTGSSVFWLAEECVDQCAAHLKSLCGTCTGNLARADFTPLPKYGCGVCETCICTYGGCAGDQPEAICPKGATCDIQITPKKAQVNIGSNAVCTYVAVGTGYASQCGGMMGIMGATDFLTPEPDRTSFLFNYFLTETGTFPTEVMNYSFEMTASPPSHYIDLKLKFQDTDVKGVAWMKRYRLKNLNFIVVRLLHVKADEKIVFEPQTGPQYVILDTGTEQGGLWQSDIASALTSAVTDEQGKIKAALPTIEFVFEGQGAHTPVSWFYTKSQYMYDMSSLDQGILDPGDTFMFHNSQFPINQMGKQMSLAGNLFLLNKRVIVDFLKPRVGTFNVVKPEDLALQSMQLGNPGANQPVQVPQFARTPRIPIVPPTLEPLPLHREGALGGALSAMRTFVPLVCS